MRVLVTGGAGFVGANFVRCLAGYSGVEQVVAADLALPDDLTTVYMSDPPGRVCAVQLDITDRAAFLALVCHYEITHLVHAAAVTFDDAGERASPNTVVDVNLGGSINALAALVECPQLQRVLLISSSGVYGTGDLAPPQTEDGPLDLHNLYAATKRCAELLGERYAAISGRPVAAARLGPIYGPLERPRRTRRATTAIHQLASALLAGHAVRVAGPGVVRDWTYVMDAAEAAVMLLNAPAWSHPVYNVSCGAAYPFSQVVEAFVRHGLKATWIDSADQADVAMRPSQARTPLNISRLRKDTGFTPRHDLAAGVDAYVAAIRAGGTDLQNGVS